MGNTNQDFWACVFVFASWCFECEWNRNVRKLEQICKYLMAQRVFVKVSEYTYLYKKSVCECVNL